MQGPKELINLTDGEVKPDMPLIMDREGLELEDINHEDLWKQAQ